MMGVVFCYPLFFERSFMIQDINSRVYLVRFISEKIVKLLTEYRISKKEMQKIFSMVEWEMENPQEQA